MIREDAEHRVAENFQQDLGESPQCGVRRNLNRAVSSVFCTDVCPEFLTRFPHRIVIRGEEELDKTPFEFTAAGNALADMASDGQSENTEETEDESEGFHYDQTGKNGDQVPKQEGRKPATQPENEQQRAVTPNLNPQRRHSLTPFRKSSCNSHEAGHGETPLSSVGLSLPLVAS
jgi:hypothetical protein